MRNSEAMKGVVMELLIKGIPSWYYYHNCDHTLYVVEKAEMIAKHEGCSRTEVGLIKTAALWHDTGFIKTYNQHEEESCKLARDYLTGNKYSAVEIEKVCGMIMATKLPQSPTNKLEEIVADADLEYLGTADASIKAGYLFREWRHLDPILNKEKWNRTQIAFLTNHHYFTRYCRENREPAKQQYLQKLIAGRV